MKRLNGKHLLVLIALCGIMGESGGLTVNVAGLFFGPVSDALGVGRGSVALGMTVCTLIGSFAGLAVTRIIRRENFKPAVLIICAMNVAATALLGLSKGLVSMYLLQAVRGVSQGLVGMVLATMMLNNWFSAGSGLFTSIVMGFSGLASALFSPVISSVIQSQGWRTGYFLSAALIALFCIPAVAFPVTLRPSDQGLSPYGAAEDESVSAAAGEDEIAAIGEGSASDGTGSAGAGKERAEAPAKSGAADPDRAAGSASGASAPAPIRKDLYVLCLLYAVFTGFLPTVIQHLPGVAESYALAATVGAAMLSVGMIANTGGKLVIGVMIDRIGTRLSVLIMGGAVALGVLSMLTVRNAAGMLAGAALIGLSYSLCTVGIVMTVKDSFGSANYSAVYPKASLCMTLTYSVGSSLIGFIYDAARSYTPILWLIMAVLAAAIAVTLVIYARIKKAVS